MPGKQDRRRRRLGKAAKGGRKGQSFIGLIEMPRTTFTAEFSVEVAERERGLRSLDLASKEAFSYRPIKRSYFLLKEDLKKKLIQFSKIILNPPDFFVC